MPAEMPTFGFKGPLSPAAGQAPVGGGKMAGSPVARAARTCSITRQTSVQAGALASKPVVLTAAQVGVALGRPARSIRRDLAGIESDGTVITSGNPTQSWALSNLPPKLQSALQTEATRRGYASVERLLEFPPQRWEPVQPLNSLDPAPVAEASKLQKALAPTLLRLSDLSLSQEEISARGLAEYTAAFGHSVSKRHFDRLLKRTLDRDAGAEDWSRLELFLPDRLATKKSTAISFGFSENWPGVLATVAMVKDVAKPTSDELSLFWDAACADYEAAVESGMPERRARRELRKMIEAKVSFVRSSGRALEQKFRRVLEKWIEGDRTATAVADLRHENSGRKKPVTLPKEFKEKLLARVHGNGGRYAQSWREAIKQGWMPADVAAAYPFNWEHKSYVPAAIRSALGPDVEILKPLRIGPKNARLKGSYISRDYSNVPSGKIFSSDDCTAPIFFWVPDETGRPLLNDAGKPIITRGQWLPWICARTQFIVTFQLIPERGYDSIEILRGIGRLHDEYGLPEQLLFENGIWKSRLIDGTRQEGVELPDYFFGLAGVGVRIRHARPRNPRAKIVESVLGQLQNQMDRLRGYGGRKPDQIPEETQRAQLLVGRGEAHPSEFFYSHPEVVKVYEGICNNFNEEPQNGKMLEGLSPRAAFEKLQESPPMKLTPELRYLLARSRVETTVKPNGIQIGKFWYKGERASALVGQRVLAWFNAEHPESICVTDLDHKNPFTLRRTDEVPAFDATPEQFAAAERANHAQTKYQRTLFGNLIHNFPEEFLRRRRGVVIAPEQAVALGIEMENQRQQNNEEATKTERRRAKGERHARAVGLNGLGRRVDDETVEALGRLERAGVKATNPLAEQP